MGRLFSFHKLVQEHESAEEEREDMRQTVVPESNNLFSWVERSSKEAASAVQRRNKKHPTFWTELYDYLSDVTRKWFTEGEYLEFWLEWRRRKVPKIVQECQTPIVCGIFFDSMRECFFGTEASFKQSPLESESRNARLGRHLKRLLERVTRS